MWRGDPDSRRQIFATGQTLITLSTGGGESPIVVPEFWVMTPDSRLRTKVTILFSPTPPYTEPFDLSATGSTLYLEEVEQDFTGPASTLLPSVALEGTRAAPTAIPKAVDLLGYSKEFVTAGDAIRGFLTIGAGTQGSFLGQVVLQARWQPDGQRLPPEEWDEIRRLCNLMVTEVSL